MKYQRVIRLFSHFVFFSIGFMLACLWYSHSNSNSKSVLLYNTPQKLESFFTGLKHSILESGLPIDSPEAIQFLEKMSECPPFAIVGSLMICYNEKKGTYIIYEKRLDQPLVEWELHDGMAGTLILHSKLEKERVFQRYTYTLEYTADGDYIKGGIMVTDPAGKISRIYFDTKGNGIFDRMDIFSDGKHIVYSLNGLLWEKTMEKEFPSYLKNYEQLLLNIQIPPVVPIIQR